MISNKIGHRLDPYIYRAFHKVFGDRGNPNFFTVMGFLATLAASILIIRDLWVAGGLMIIVSGFFDLLDGALARNLGKVTPFGGFLDSVLDRYSDLFLLLALLIYYLQRGDTAFVILASFVSIGTGLISYTRARAEAARISCNIGLLERAERIILLSAGVLFGWIVPVFWVLAILTHFPVLQRIHYVWKQLNHP
jgi:CDP-diacylglycerol--glycerol-3-phosphate 3-phosphatidyltransferase